MLTYRNKISFFLVLMVILFSKSIYFSSFGIQANLLLIPLFLFTVTVIFFSKEPLIISKYIIGYILLFLLLVLVNTESRHEAIAPLSLRLLIAGAIVSYISFKNFSLIYISIVKFLALTSLLTWVVVYLDIGSIFPNFTSFGTREFTNYILFGVISDGTQLYRISGLWWEPGAFQLFINIAYMFEIINNRKISYKKFLLYCIFISGVGSTTGVIVFLLLSAAHFFKNRNYIFPVIIFFSIFLVILISFNIAGFDKFDSSSTSYESFSSRYLDAVISFNMFIDNIFIGYGYGALDKYIPYGVNLIGYDAYYSGGGEPYGTSGILMLVAQCGVLMIVFLLPVFIPKFASHLPLVSRILISLSILILFNTENLAYFLIFTVLLLYGIVGIQKPASRPLFLDKHKNYG